MCDGYDNHHFCRCFAAVLAYVAQLGQQTGGSRGNPKRQGAYGPHQPKSLECQEDNRRRASTVTSGYIQFVDFNDFNDRYDVAASDSYVEYGVVGSLSDLAGPVNSFKFTCYDANITLLSPVTDTNLIRLVKVDATVDNSASNGKDKTYTTWAYLRTGANASPTISITQPTDGNSSFTAPASITISATASDSDGTVSKVDFYQGATLLGTDTARLTLTHGAVLPRAAIV